MPQSGRHNTNIIYYAKAQPKPSKALKFNNIPDDLFETIISRASKVSKVKHTIEQGPYLYRLREYVVFYKKNSSQLYLIPLDECLNFATYFQSVLETHIDTPTSFQRYKIRKSEYSYNTYLKPEDLKYELKEITTSEKEETVKTMVNSLKLLEVNKSKAIRLTEDSTLQDWFIWIDELDRVCFQPVSCFLYQDCTEQLFSFRYYSADGDDPFTPTASVWEQRKKRRRVFPTSPQSPTNESPIDSGFIRYFSENNIATESGLPRIIVHKFKTITSRLQKYLISLKYSISESDNRLLRIMYYFCLNHTRGLTHHVYSRMFQNRFHDSEVLVNEGVIQISYSNQDRTKQIIKYILDIRLLPDTVKIIDAQEYQQHSKEKEMTKDTFEESIYKMGKLFTILEELKYYFLFHHGIRRNDDTICFIHELTIQYIPKFVLNDYIRNSYDRIQFFNDDMTTKSDGVDYGGIKRQYINMLGKSFFRPIQNPEINKRLHFGTNIDMDKDNRFPYFATHCVDKTPEDKELICNRILLFFRDIIEDHHITLGHVLPFNFFDAISELSRLENLCTSRNILWNDFHLYSDEIRFMYYHVIFRLLLDFLKPAQHQIIFAKFIQKYINYLLIPISSPDSSPQWKSHQTEEWETDKNEILVVMNAMGYDDIDEASLATTIYDVGMNEIIRKKVDPILEFLFYMKKAMKNDLDIQWDLYPTNLFGNQFDRQQIANCIQINTTHPIMWNSSTTLRRHILNEATSKEWIESFLMTVTGSTEITSSTKIYLQRTAECRIPVAHTCTSTIDVFGGTSHDQYVINEEAAALYEDEFGKRPESHSEKFIASINYMIKLSASQFTLA